MIRFRVVAAGEFVRTGSFPRFSRVRGGVGIWALPLGLGGLCRGDRVEMALTQIAGTLTRGYGFKWRHLLWIPSRPDFVAAFVRGGTMRWVDWRGNRLLVLRKTRLAEIETVQRAKNIQRLSGEHLGSFPTRATPSTRRALADVLRVVLRMGFDV